MLRLREAVRCYNLYSVFIYLLSFSLFAFFTFSLSRMQFLMYVRTLVAAVYIKAQVTIKLNQFNLCLKKKEKETVGI